jgi:hypothetical protein
MPYGSGRKKRPTPGGVEVPKGHLAKALCKHSLITQNRSLNCDSLFVKAV